MANNGNKMASSRCRAQRSPGVTLLEILVAVGILAFSISAIIQIFPMGFSASAKASYTAIAYELASQKMEEIRATNIFGGDGDPDKTCDNVNTYKYFGHRTHPIEAIYGTSGYNDNNNESMFAFHAFDTNSAIVNGVNVESKYFYRVEMVPQVDVTQKSGNYIALYGSSDPNDKSCRFGFPDSYRIKVTVRGPVRKLEYAQDANWVHYKKGAAEATLATIITNKEMGVAYLAYDLICRTISVDNKASGKEDMWNDGYHLDSRSIYVTGFNNKRFYPEAFAVIRPDRLTNNERWDTGPAIAFPFTTMNDSNIDSAYYASRQGGGRHAYTYARDVFAKGSGTTFNQSSNGDYNQTSGMGVQQRTLLDEYGGSSIDFDKLRKGKHVSGTAKVASNVNWDDMTWRTGDSKIGNINPSSAFNYPYTVGHIGTTSGTYDGKSYVPGGLNLLGQDNIMLMCRLSPGSSNRNTFIAESNKLVFMVPPKTTTEVVTATGSAYKAANKTPYWRFDLLNQVYGRDGDSKHRNLVYGAQPLVDNSCGVANMTNSNPASDAFYYKIGRHEVADLILGHRAPNGDYNGTTTTPYSGTLEVGTSNISAYPNGNMSVNPANYYRVYGYPKARWSSGNFYGGTVVRFLMTMPTKS